MNGHLSALETLAKSLAAPSSGSSVSPGLTSVEARAGKIAQLKTLYAEIQKLTSVVARCGAEAEAVQRREIRVVQERLSRVSSHTPPPSGLNPHPSRREDPNPHPSRREDRTDPGCKTVRLTSTVSLEATVIPESVADPMSHVTGPDVYYIPRWNHFAFRVGPLLLHGNIGKIYTDGRAPRIKDCRHPHCVRREDDTCTFFHDPKTHSGSRDVRNYAANSRTYTTPTFRHTAPHGTRQLGSRDSLDVDLANISPQNSRQFLDQITHDILCAMAIVRAGREKN